MINHVRKYIMNDEIIALFLKIHAGAMINCESTWPGLIHRVSIFSLPILIYYTKAV